jgi:hypothetical protein
MREPRLKVERSSEFHEGTYPSLTIHIGQSDAELLAQILHAVDQGKLKSHARQLRDVLADTLRQKGVYRKPRG